MESQIGKITTLHAQDAQEGWAMTIVAVLEKDEAGNKNEVDGKEGKKPIAEDVYEQLRKICLSRNGLCPDCGNWHGIEPRAGFDEKELLEQIGLNDLLDLTNFWMVPHIRSGTTRCSARRKHPDRISR